MNRDLRYNGISGAIATEIGHLTSLAILRLGPQSINTHHSIPSELGLCTNLEEIDFAGIGLRSTIPTELYGLSGLRKLHLGGAALPELIFGGLTIYANNYIEGTLSPLISQLSSIEEISLNGNSLSSSIVSDIGDLATLKVV